MKKLLTTFLLTLILVGCSDNSSVNQLPVPGDYDFIGPIKTTEAE